MFHVLWMKILLFLFSFLAFYFLYSIKFIFFFHIKEFDFFILKPVAFYAEKQHHLIPSSYF